MFNIHFDPCLTFEYFIIMDRFQSRADRICSNSVYVHESATAKRMYKTYIGCAYSHSDFILIPINIVILT